MLVCIPISHIYIYKICIEAQRRQRSLEMYFRQGIRGSKNKREREQTSKYSIQRQEIRSDGTDYHGEGEA